MSYQLLVIGASIGGSKAITAILKELPRDFPVPIAIVLHRAKNVDTLSGFFQKNCVLKVLEVEDKMMLQKGYVYLAPADYHLIVDKNYFSLSLDELVHFARPSIDVLFESAADSFRAKVIGLLLTGSSSDGAEGLLLIKQAGGYTIVEDPKTAESKIMPEAALELQAASQVLALDKIPRHLIKLCQYEEMFPQGKTKI
ncbi:chemotaxis protein CheB [Legionella maioricensis]|uniref:protein-glutamate methylesterase n=1 Tax=Legionella maioricensis TaxID=2896528 RepID=A0A9X2CYA5_9GAMM|nr:chemotaxis protein CheB [Legionella maioricensis]MCL9682710.1 chemotaxis protein CheB [Legionella maioricensis]MCL9687242.1 chemotaxis protein CheB [Legionella maioricensis]